MFTGSTWDSGPVPCPGIAVWVPSRCAGTSPLNELAVDPRLDSPKGEIVVVVGPGEAVQATEADADAALIDALQTLSTGDAASEVAKALGLNRKTLYRRALELKGK